jgi:hypothetical protein
MAARTTSFHLLSVLLSHDTVLESFYTNSNAGGGGINAFKELRELPCFLNRGR